ncbi:hypothetical protein DFQ26_002334, partial [Actinomortierella ambigua]
PYTVIRRTTDGAYILKDGTGQELHRQYAPSQLKLVLEDFEDGEVFEVEHILEHEEIQPGVYKYHVKWKGYPSSSNTWEPIESFIETQCIADYWADKEHMLRSGTSVPRLSSPALIGDVELSPSVRDPAASSPPSPVPSMVNHHLDAESSPSEARSNRPRRQRRSRASSARRVDADNRPSNTTSTRP